MNTLIQVAAVLNLVLLAAIQAALVLRLLPQEPRPNATIKKAEEAEKKEHQARAAAGKIIP